VSEIATLTHARLRAAQGDVVGARRIVAEILRHEPQHPEAQELLPRLGAGRGRPAELADEPAPGPPEAGDPAQLAARFQSRLAGVPPPRDPRIVRLEDWLQRIRGVS